MTAKEHQFSLSSLMLILTIAALVIAVVGTVLQSRRTQSQLNRQIVSLQADIVDLEYRLRGEQGQSIRTKYAEKMLFHVLARSGKYPELVAALQNGSKRQVGMSLHPLDEDDNRTYVNFYSMGDAPGTTPFCFSFLLSDEPFEVLDHISGEQGRLPRKQEPNGIEGDWFCGADEGGSDVWYRIADDQFKPYAP